VLSSVRLVENRKGFSLEIVPVPVIRMMFQKGSY
jgi:hypothetical protein